MIILLPPSEGKFIPQQGPALDIDARPVPLRQPTRVVLEALSQLCLEDPERARGVLGISAAQSRWLQVNADLDGAPTAAAHDIYSGVLYQALDYHSLGPSARQRADHMVWVASALYGVVRLGESIASYRMSGGTTLPGVPRAAKLWQEPISEVLADVDPPLVVDMRSGAYANLWRPSPSLADRYVSVKVWQLDARGQRTAVSHHNKATKGLLARELMRTSRQVRSSRALEGAAQRAGERHGWQAHVVSGQLDLLLR